MLNSKLYDYLLKCTPYELNRFSKYMRSPLYNDDDKLVRLTEAVLPIAKKKLLHEADEQQLWKAVHGKTKYNRAKYNRLLSDTVKKLEHFLVIDKFNQQRNVQAAYQLAIMNERKLDKHVPEQLALAFRKHKENKLHDALYYHTVFLLQQQRNLHLENKDQRSIEKNLQDVADSLDVYYFYQKLKYTAAMLHYKNFLSVEAETPLLQDVMKVLNDAKYREPGIQIYRRIILSFTDAENEIHYAELKKLITDSISLFPVEEQKAMFVFAMNYCINRINYGKAEYLAEVFDLYKYALNNDLLLEDGCLSQWDYKNITTVALRLKDYKWADKFLHDYKTILPKADRTNAYTFNMARYYFAVQKYERVLQLLQDVKYNDIFYQLDSKTTLLKTYYELGEWQPLYSLKDSFRVMLRRKKLISQQQQENYMNLLKLSMKLFRIDVKNKTALNAIKSKIENTQNVADKTWLLEKLQELGA